MIVLESGTKEYIHNGQFDMNSYIKARYGAFPPLSLRGW